MAHAPQTPRARRTTRRVARPARRSQAGATAGRTGIRARIRARWPLILIVVPIKLLLVFFAGRHLLQGATSMIQAHTAGGYALIQGRLQDELALRNSTLVADLAATCATTPDAFSAAVRSASVLDACRRTDPGVTLDALVARMGARVGSRLQMPVTMGMISAGDAARLSADTRDHLRASLAAAPAPMRLDG